MSTLDELTLPHLDDPFDCQEEAACSDEFNYLPGNYVQPFGYVVGLQKPKLIE